MSRLVNAAASAIVGFSVTGVAFAYSFLGYDWVYDGDPITENFVLNVSGFPAATGSAADVQAALEGAMESWSTDGAAMFTYRSGGTTTSTSWTDDSSNITQYYSGSYGGSTLAVAHSYSSSGDVTDCDIRFYSRNSDGDITWSADPLGSVAGAFDLQRVATHEYGHCLGLDHSSDSSAIMYATTGSGTSTAGRVLSADDIDGIQAIYGSECSDLDGDGYGRAESCGGDCDDTDSTINSGAAEVCDGVDQDCDDVIDDGFDLDGDDYTSCDGDCDDTDGEISPDATEVCNGIDDNCDGLYYADETVDNDGDSVIACEDCDDAEPTTYPAAIELCDEMDNDCDGYVDNDPASESEFGDRTSSSSSSGRVYGNAYHVEESRLLHSFEAYLDPSGTVAATFAVLVSDSETGDYVLVASTSVSISGSSGWYSSGELGITLESGRYYTIVVSSGSSTFTWYRDTTPSLATVGGLTPVGYQAYVATSVPSPFTTNPVSSVLYAQRLLLGGPEDADGDGYAPLCDDCDDDNVLSYPAAAEQCDGEDNDCDGALPANEGDADGDGSITCADCDDGSATTYPGATEACNAIDDDCSGAPGTTEVDADGDGLMACDTDCDDTNAAINPAATEICDTIDNDCDGIIDSTGATAAATVTFGDATSNASISGDIYGNVVSASEDMTLSSFSAYLDPSGTVTATFQVYEASSSTGTYSRIASAASSISGTAGWYDSGTLNATFRDGYYYAVMVGVSTTTTFYRDSGPALTTNSYLTPAGYLYDSSSATPSSITNNPSSSYLYYHRMSLVLPSADEVDDDADGYTEFCDDCNDADATISPGDPESCDGVDEDCDGAVGIDEVDLDGDGAMVCEGDCDDADATILPTAVEACNGIDDDCSGAPGSTEIDVDGDGYMICENDCDDVDPYVNPSAAEICDAADNDCEGTTDQSGEMVAETPSWGDASSSGSISGDAYGNVYSPSMDVHLSAISAYLDPSSTVTATFAIYSATSPTATYSLVTSAAGSISGSAGWYSATGLDVTLAAGKYYAVVVGVSGTTTFYRDASPSLTEDSFLTPSGYIYDSTSATPTSISNNPSTTYLYYQRLSLDVTAPEDIDDDIDGFTEYCDDCNDANATIYPGASESCDGVDDDCDGALASSEADVDADGSMLCEGDCDDADVTSYPLATELCDGVDNDCDGSAAADEIDADADSYMVCEDDCEDADPLLNPASTEVCDGIDNNCDGATDQSGVLTAATPSWGDSGSSASISGDAYGNVYSSSTDMQLATVSAYLDPSGTVTATFGVYSSDTSTGSYTLVDSSSSSISGSAGWFTSGALDISLQAGKFYAVVVGVSGTTTYYRDNTPSFAASSYLTPAGFVYDSSSAAPTSLENDPSSTYLYYQRLAVDVAVGDDIDDDGDGYSEFCDDCDDAQSSASPSGSEVCDDVDNDCDGVVDVGASDAPSWFLDSDADGQGTTLSASVVCDQPTGYVANASDCNDTEAGVFVGAEEWCNAVDDDCDGAVDDEAVDANQWFADVDADSFGDALAWVFTCDEPADFVTDNQDCDDGSALVFPGATETCNGDDDDCDGAVDDAAADATTWYADADGDGFGDALSSASSCDAPTGYVADASDCDDTNSAMFLGNIEVWYDGVDNDCDGNDSDQDGDGFAALVAGGDDCVDTDVLIFMGAYDAWYDGADTNCWGDDDFDSDADGHRSSSHGGDDCDDSSVETYPGAPDAAYDGVINDCDAAGEYDVDGDGYDSADFGGTDCDDANSVVNPSVTEIWYDGTDNDCDGNDTDQDGDGFVFGLDCDDTDASVYPDSSGIGSDCLPLSVDTGDTGEADTGTADTGAADTGAADTGDSGSWDTGVADTAGAETGAADSAETGGLDTGGLDTGSLDTGGVDTGGVDTGNHDSGSSDTADTGRIDTGAEDTSTGDDTGVADTDDSAADAGDTGEDGGSVNVSDKDTGPPSSGCACQSGGDPSSVALAGAALLAALGRRRRSAAQPLGPFTAGKPG